MILTGPKVLSALFIYVSTPFLLVMNDDKMMMMKWSNDDDADDEWSKLLVLYFYETFIYFRRDLNLNCYMGK